MSSSSSESESFYDSDESEINFIPEVEIDQNRQRGPTGTLSDDDELEEDQLFADEPLADQEWTARYEEERRANEELERTLSNRLEGTESVSQW